MLNIQEFTKNSRVKFHLGQTFYPDHAQLEQVRHTRCQKKTIEVDSDMIDRAVNELAKLILRLDKNP